MNIILDLIVIAIIAVTMFLSSKHGFVRTAIELVGFVAAIFLSFTISTPLADVTYDKIIEPPIISAVSSATSDNAADIIDKTWEALPEFITSNSEKIGISKTTIDTTISENITNGAEVAAKSASQTAVKPIVTRLLGLIFTSILLIILLIVVKFVARLVNRLFSFSIIGKANRFLGGIVGFFKGAILAIAFCLVISLIVSLTKDGFLIFTAEAIENSYLFKLLCNVTPFKIG